MTSKAMVVAAVAALLAAVANHPVNAALVAGNGEVDLNVAAPSVDSGDISGSTMFLTLDGITVQGFVDPINGAPNNFCGAATDGCTAAHPPGFLLGPSAPGGPSTGSIDPLYVGPVGVAVPDIIHLDLTQGADELGFVFSIIQTTELQATAAGTEGILSLSLIGLFASDTSASYETPQPALLRVTCTQAFSGATLDCDGPGVALDTSPAAVPEPASLALLCTALAGLGAVRRRMIAGSA